jgi:hypothetical membrane protein
VGNTISVLLAFYLIFVPQTISFDILHTLITKINIAFFIFINAHIIDWFEMQRTALSKIDDISLYR